MSQDEIIHVGGKECAHKGSRVEELRVGCDHHSSFKWLQDLNEFLLCTEKAGDIIILISGIGACEAGVGEGLSLVIVLMEFHFLRGKKENSGKELKELMRTFIETPIMWPKEN